MGRRSYRFDLHAHTIRSDGVLEPGELAGLARSRGLWGVAITDHNRIWEGEIEGLLVIPGVEVSSSEGHILGYMVQEPIPRGLGAEETIERIREAGGIAVPAHPLRVVDGIGEGRLLQVVEKVDAVEAVNGRNTVRKNRRTLEIARSFGKPVTAGSDAHYPWELGRCGVTMDWEPEGPWDVMEAVLKGEVGIFGLGITVGTAAKNYYASILKRVIGKKRAKGFLLRF